MKKDCFGYKMGKCTALTEMVCAKKECSFYKTIEQFKADVEKANKILQGKGLNTDGKEKES